MNITIINGYTWYNKGDAGILIGHINEINGVMEELNYSDYKIDIFSFTPDIDRLHYTKLPNVNHVYSNILNPYPFKKTRAGKVNAIVKLAFNSIKQNVLFNTSGKKSIGLNQLEILKESDVIIVCGGGFLGGKKFNSLTHLHQINIASQLGKPIFLWGTSIEPPKNKLVQFLTESVISKLSHVYSREDITTDYLNTFLSSNKYSFSPDLAFTVPKEINGTVEKIYTKLPMDRNLIGITMRDWHFPKSENKESDKEKYINSLVTLIEDISEKLNCTFVFIPQVIMSGDDDRKIAEEIKNRVNAKQSNNFIVLKDDLSPQEIKGLISKFKMFVGTRMHSNIFATGAHVPTVAIAYESKTNGIMKMLDLTDYVIDIEEITPEIIKELVTNCFENTEKITSHLEKKIPEIESKIREKSVFLKEYI